jgi:uncharacterized protein (TIGR02145 family)
MYEGAKITNIGNAHSVKLSGGYKCFIDGEISGMKGNKGWDATDRSTNERHEGRGFKSAVLFDSHSVTLDTLTGLSGSAIIGENANIYNNAIKCGAVGVSRSTSASVKIYGKINDNMGQTGTSWQTVGSLTLPVPYGANGGGIYVVLGGTVYLEEGSEVCRNSVMNIAYGGGINIQQNGSKLIMNGGLVQGNTVGGSGTTPSMGPGIAVNKSGDCYFEMNGGIVDNGPNGVLLFNNRASIFGQVREDNDCNSRLILNGGAVSGVTVQSNVAFGNNTINQYRNLYIKDNVVVHTGYVAVGGILQSATSTINIPRQVTLLPAGSFADITIGNPNKGLYPTILSGLPVSWTLPTTNDNVIAFWIKKAGKAEFSVPAPTSGTAPTDYDRDLKYFVAVLETNATGAAASGATVKLYPTKMENGQIVVSVPLGDYPNGATVALVQPSNIFDMINIACPTSVEYNENLAIYTIPYNASYKMPNNLYSLLTSDGHNNSNTNIKLSLFSDMNTVPDLTNMTLNSDIFELSGTPVWNATNGEVIVPLQFKSGWETAMDTAISFSLPCTIDKAIFENGNMLTLIGQIEIDGLNTYLILSNEATILMPTFDLADALTYCVGETPTALPTNSTNTLMLITGTWFPETISTTMAGGPTTYTFTPTSGICAVTKAITVTVNATPTLTIIPTSKDTTVCRNTSVDFYLSSLAYTEGLSNIVEVNASKAGGSWNEVVTSLHVELSVGAGMKLYYRARNTVTNCTSEVDSVTMHVTALATAADILIDDYEICRGEEVILTAMSTNVINNPTFYWYESQTATTPVHTGATYPTRLFTSTTEFYVSVFDTDHCENEAGDRKKVTVTVIICKLLDCEALIDRVAEEDGYREGKYSHFGTEWDVVPVMSIDSMQYYINEELFSSGTTASLNGAEFPVGASTVIVIAYYRDIEDICEFNVAVTKACSATISDDEGNVYKVTKLAGLCWTENMKATKYAVNLGEEEIPFAKPYSSIQYPDTNLNTELFGLLYDWYSAVGPSPSTHAQGICPEYWHVPSQKEWGLLAQFPATALMSTQYWINSGTDNYGFDARPAGWYNGATERFEDLYGFTGWWASDDDVVNNLFARYFYLSYYCDIIREKTTSKADGLSVRCVMN